MAGCSFVPDGKAEGSCDAHDIDYKQIWNKRMKADKRFLISMLEASVWEPKAYLYYYGVRIFGRFFI